MVAFALPRVPLALQVVLHTASPGHLELSASGGVKKDPTLPHSHPTPLCLGDDIGLELQRFLGQGRGNEPSWGCSRPRGPSLVGIGSLGAE